MRRRRDCCESPGLSWWAASSARAWNRMGNRAIGFHLTLPRWAVSFRSEGWSVGLIGAGRDRMVVRGFNQALLPEAVGLRGKNVPARAGRVDSPRPALRHQRFRPDASSRRARHARWSRFLVRPILVWVGPYGQPDSGGARGFAVLSVLSPQAAGLSVQSSVHARSDAADGHRSRSADTRG